MEQTNKKSNIFLALLLSLLTALGGGVLFGLIYAFGYSMYLLALGEIVLAVTVFFKINKNISKKTITLAIIWGVLWTFLFNVLSIVICEAIIIAKEFNATFANSYKALIELWKTNAEIKAYMNKRVLQVSAMILLGGFIYGVSYLVQYNKTKKLNQRLMNTNEQNHAVPANSTQKSSNENFTAKLAQNVEIKAHLDEENKEYNNIFNECKKAIINYAKDKDLQNFKSQLKDIKQKYLSTMSVETKEKIVKISLSKLQDVNISAIDKKSIETLLKIIN